MISPKSRLLMCLSLNVKLLKKVFKNILWVCLSQFSRIYNFKNVEHNQSKYAIQIKHPADIPYSMLYGEASTIRSAFSILAVNERIWKIDI